MRSSKPFCVDRRLGAGLGLAIAIFAIFAISAPAQNWARLQTNPVPAGTVATTAVVLDLDVDGDLDLAIGWPVTLLVNDGDGHFVPHPTRPTPFLNSYADRNLHTGDIDGDGDLDLVAPDGWVESVINGAPPVHPVLFDMVKECADFTGDGRADVLSGTQLFVAGAGGTFVALPASPLVTAALDTATADLDGDGDPDLLLADGPSASIKVLRNDGAGTFTDVSTQWGRQLPAVPTRLLIGDVDGDGNVDCVAAGAAWMILRNDGTGRMVFTNSAPLNAADANNQLIDLDGDHALDIAGATSWLRGGGQGAFTLMSALPTGTHTLLAVANLDTDGKPDLVCTTIGSTVRPLRLFRNRLPDPFLATYREPLTFPFASGRSQLVDIDLDGDIDRVGEGFILRNDGHGSMTQTPAPWGALSLVHAGDLDGDGLPDVIVNEVSGRAIRRFLRTGPTWADAGPTTLPMEPLLVFDADGDADDDLLMTGMWLARNDGAGNFAADPSGAIGGTGIHNAVVADFDGDGDRDVLGADTRLHMFVNDGAGTFTWSPNRLGIMAPFYPRTLAAGDADGDGDVDAFAWGIAGSSLLLRNIGGGVLVPVQNLLGTIPGEVYQGQAVDIDADGDLDAVVLTDQGFLQLLNRGDGVLLAPTTISPEPTTRVSNWIADIDGDGDPDLVLGDRVMVSRQWHALAPYITCAGAALDVDFGSTVAPTSVAVPFAAAPLSRPLPLPPFGTLGIDPTQLLPLPITPIASNAGRMHVPVPANPAIVGITLGVQAVITSGTQTHLTPTVIVTIE